MPEPLLQDTRWIVTTVIAGWGAILATSQLVMTLLRNRSKVKVALQLGSMSDVPVYFIGQENPQVMAMAVNVVNDGQVDVRFEPDCCSAEVKGHSKRIAVDPEYSDPRLPATISRGHNLRMQLRARTVFEGIDQVARR